MPGEQFCCASDRSRSNSRAIDHYGDTHLTNRRVLRQVLSAIKHISVQHSIAGHSMRYIKLGQTGLDVSPIAIGAMTYGEPNRGHPVWSSDEEASRPLIKHALDAGINFFDTANMYSQGSSEEILGRALKDFARRDDVVIATKVRHPMRPGPNGAGLSRKAIFAEIDHSLHRLGTDYVDLYQIHRLDQATPIEETLEALHDVVKAGKVRYLGASSMHAWEFSKALHLQRAHGWSRFVSMQDHYNLLAREEEREMLPLCADEGVGTIVWSPLARGRLTRPWDETTKRSQSDPFAGMLYTNAASDRLIVEAVADVASVRGVSRAQVALAWLRRNPVVVAPIIGASKTSHIDDAVASLTIDLTDEEVSLLESPYTPRYDFQGISDAAELARISARIGIKPAAA
jgi:aryl-alcohol dehydrogenase-like predicted oxidoreductase